MGMKSFQQRSDDHDVRRVTEQWKLLRSELR